jgi:putative flippase GtrA
MEPITVPSTTTGMPRPAITPRLLGRGLAATGLHALATVALLQAGSHPWLAASLGFAAGLAANYGLQRGYILRHPEPPGRALSRYVADTSVLWALHGFAFGLMAGVSGVPFVAAQVASSTLAAGLGLLCFGAHGSRRTSLVL